MWRYLEVGDDRINEILVVDAFTFNWRIVGIFIGKVWLRGNLALFLRDTGSVGLFPVSELKEVIGDMISGVEAHLSFLRNRSCRRRIWLINFGSFIRLLSSRFSLSRRHGWVLEKG